MGVAESSLVWADPNDGPNDDVYLPKSQNAQSVSQMDAQRQAIKEQVMKMMQQKAIPVANPKSVVELPDVPSPEQNGDLQDDEAIKGNVAKLFQEKLPPNPINQKNPSASAALNYVGPPIILPAPAAPSPPQNMTSQTVSTISVSPAAVPASIAIPVAAVPLAAAPPAIAPAIVAPAVAIAAPAPPVKSAQGSPPAGGTALPVPLGSSTIIPPSQQQAAPSKSAQAAASAPGTALVLPVGTAVISPSPPQGMLPRTTGTQAQSTTIAPAASAGITPNPSQILPLGGPPQAAVSQSPTAKESQTVAAGAAPVTPALQPAPATPPGVSQPPKQAVPTESSPPVKTVKAVSPEDQSLPNMSEKVLLQVEDGEAEADTAFLRTLAGSDTILVSNPSSDSSGPTFAESIDLSESVAFALRNNFEILAGVEKSRSAYWDKVGAYSEFAPSMQFNYSQGAEKSDPASYNDEFGNRVLTSTHFRRDRDLTIRQPIIDLSVISDILSSGDKENIAKTDQRDAREGIASDTVNVFLKLLQARISIHLAEQYKSYLDNLSERMKARVEGGGGTNADLERIKSRSAVAENARIEAIGEFETEVSEYRRLTKVAPSQLRIPQFLVPTVPADMQSALQVAYKTNPAYRSSLEKIDAAQDDRNKSFSNLLPKLSVQYGKDFTYDAGGAAKGNPVDGVYPDQTTEAIELVASWSLNGGTDVASGISGIAKEKQMDFLSQDVRARMEQNVRSSYTALRAAKERRTALRKSVEANEKVVKDFDEQFKFGNRSLFDLLDAYEQLYTSRVNLMRIIIANAEASYQVHRQMGDLIPSVVGEEKEQ